MTLQGVNLLIRILYDLFHGTGAQWLSQSVVPDIVKWFRNDKLSRDKLLHVVENIENH